MSFKLTVGVLALSLALPLALLDGAEAGMATRYWDCCLGSASWAGKAPVWSPVDVCKADGVTLVDATTAASGQSGCNGGDLYMCSCMQPFEDSTDPTLAYGFAAFTAGNEEATDCACYFAEFEHDGSGKPMKRNKLLFQVTNTGGDVNSGNIDFQIPGGGLGAFTQGCPAQWKTPAEKWGETYGGVKAVEQCSNLPEPLQEGCKWRFTSWGDNPVLKGAPKRVKCPKSLIDRSGCQRKDDNTVGAYQGKTDASCKPAEANYKRDRSVCTGGAGGKSSSGSGSGRGSGSGSGSDTGAGSGGNPPEGYGAGSGAGSGAGPDTGAGGAGDQAEGYGAGSVSTPAPKDGATTAPGTEIAPVGSTDIGKKLKKHRKHRKAEVCDTAH